MTLRVMFQSVYAPYNPGEQADFPDALANRLVAEGVATPVAWSPNATTESEALQAFEGGDTAQEAAAEAAHLAGDVGKPGEAVGGQ
jgi:hypothetical protein